jgi:hypothetical protein
VDSEGEQALMAVVVLDDPEADGWPGDFTFELLQWINRLAVQIGLDEYVWTGWVRGGLVRGTGRGQGWVVVRASECQRSR